MGELASAFASLKFDAKIKRIKNPQQKIGLLRQNKPITFLKFSSIAIKKRLKLAIFLRPDKQKTLNSRICIVKTVHPQVLDKIIFAYSLKGTNQNFSRFAGFQMNEIVRIPPI
jgi:hypothetical protein